MINAAIDTIAAISTPIGFGGIGIVRISGSGCIDIARKVFRRRNTKVTTKTRKNAGLTAMGIIPRRLHYGYIVDPENNAVFNEVLMAYMPAPNSYTMEDVVEIQAHGGAESLKAILDLVNRNGARLADPGEFTRRAFLNGRIDLSQAEAIIDVIQAKTEASLKIANKNLEGDVGATIRNLQSDLLEIKVMLEAQIDFPDDAEEKSGEREVGEKIRREIIGPLNALIEGYGHGHLVREGVKLVIVGRTNVGKSSLLNRFLGRERAIVTAYPGTTRDSIDESISLFGIPTVIVDTAGWRDTFDPVEKIGIERTRDLAHTADLILFLVDASTGVVSEDDDLYSKIQEKETFLIVNKMDLLDGDACVNIPKHWRVTDVLYTSAKFGNGFEEMRGRLYKRLIGCDMMSEPETVPNLRQKTLLEKAKRSLEGAISGPGDSIHGELMSIDIQEAMDALDEITGAKVKPDILDEIFSRFCIGK